MAGTARQVARTVRVAGAPAGSLADGGDTGAGGIRTAAAPSAVPAPRPPSEVMGAR
ncbi:hypothetical protein AB0O07_11385 [Streptomyces sp. NPDC093085]|uniref:hypothetical protein n=1 Tax=Streptomyces sp. NPDC093085 TaxID=3155068 RepID=UPI003446E041